MKIYLDDIRDCPDGFILCRTAEEAIALIKTGQVTFISFDHDLGTELTGYDVAKFIEEAYIMGELKLFPQWRIHSANPVGVRNIMAALLKAEGYFI